MSRYYLEIPKSALKSMAKIPLPWAFRIKQVIERLPEEPFLGEKMDGSLKDRRKLRVWPYRIIYRVDKKNKYVKIMEIEHRGNISYD